jgi:hypothetical protein
MTSEYTSQLATELLLSGFVSVLALGICAAIVSVLYVRQRRTASSMLPEVKQPGIGVTPAYQPSVFEHSCRWCVVKGKKVSAVQSALGLHNPTPCSWNEGTSGLGSHQLFVSPPIRGWILIVGPGLPDPCEDAEKCFHFLVQLSRSLGEVQCFSVNRAANHHAWVRLNQGKIRRAYAWAGDTLWNQGRPTQAERELAVRCAAYGERPPAVDPSISGFVGNSDKVPQLAARWSFDPAAISQSMLQTGLGVAGDVTQLPRH